MPNQAEQHYRFDPAGKRLAPEEAGLMEKWQDNRIREDGTWRYEYDAKGNLIQKVSSEETHSYAYDGLNRLIQFRKETPTGMLDSQYIYDPFGRRLAKQVVHGDTDGNLTSEVQTTWFGWDGDRLVATETGGQAIHTRLPARQFRAAGEAGR